MLACRSLISIVARSSTITSLQPKPLRHFQTYKFFRDVCYDLKMSGRNRRVDIGRKGENNLAQNWRRLHTEATTYEEPESSEPEIVTGDFDKVDISSDEKLVPPEKHSTLMEVGEPLMRFIKGKWGSTQKEIEAETGVKIKFPPYKTGDFIRIEGSSPESVAKASEKIQAIIEQAVNGRGLDYSHFISFPLAIHPGLVDKLVKFQNTILGIATSDKDENANSDTDGGTLDEVDQSDLGIEKSIFIKPKTFHLTVLMLKLWNKDRVRAAAEVLQRISPKVMDALDNKSVSIRLKGLNCMKGSLAEARVIYAPVEEIGDEGRLLHACQVIREAFVEAGLVIERDAQQGLKLHATIMNVRHRKRKNWSNKVYSFDARGIFDLYGSFEWGEYPIREAHLSERFAFDENGYYHCCASIPFPVEMHVD